MGSGLHGTHYIKCAVLLLCNAWFDISVRQVLLYICIGFFLRFADKQIGVILAFIKALAPNR